MRFTAPGQKAVVVCVLLAVNAILVLVAMAVRSEAFSVALSLVQLVGWYLASRVFRGPGEPVRAIRPWWRMTNRPALSGVLGAGYAVAAVVNAGFALAGFGGFSGVVSILVQVILAGLFLMSFVRLRALAAVGA